MALDGTQLKTIEETFDVLDSLFNLKDLENGILNKILK